MKEELINNISTVVGTMRHQLINVVASGDFADSDVELLKRCDNILTELNEFQNNHTYTPLSEKVPTVEEVGEHVLVYCEKWVCARPQVKPTIILDTGMYLQHKEYYHWAKLPEKS